MNTTDKRRWLLLAATIVFIAGTALASYLLAPRQARRFVPSGQANSLGGALASYEDSLAGFRFKYPTDIFKLGRNPNGDITLESNYSLVAYYQGESGEESKHRFKIEFILRRLPLSAAMEKDSALFAATYDSEKDSGGTSDPDFYQPLYTRTDLSAPSFLDIQGDKTRYAYFSKNSRETLVVKATLLFSDLSDFLVANSRPAPFSENQQTLLWRQIIDSLEFIGPDAAASSAKIDWRTYINTELGYSLRYPKEFEVFEMFSSSSYFSPSKKIAAGPDSVGVTVVDIDVNKFVSVDLRRFSKQTIDGWLSEHLADYVAEESVFSQTDFRLAGRPMREIITSGEYGSPFRLLIIEQGGAILVVSQYIFSEVLAGIVNSINFTK